MLLKQIFSSSWWSCYDQVVSSICQVYDDDDDEYDDHDNDEYDDDEYDDDDDDNDDDRQLDR